MPTDKSRTQLTPRPAKNTYGNIDLLFDIACFGLVASAFYFVSQFGVYSFSSLAAPPLWLGIGAVLCGLLAIPLGRLGRCVTHLTDPRWTFGVLAALGGLFLLTLTFIPNFNEYAFHIPLNTQISEHEESSPQGKVVLRDYLFRKNTPVHARWVVIARLYADNPDMGVPLFVSFSGSGLPSKQMRLDLKGGEPPRGLEELDKYDTVQISYPAAAPVQFRADATVMLTDNLAALTHVGACAVWLLPLMLLGMVAAGITKNLVEARRYLRTKTIWGVQPSTDPTSASEPTYGGFLQLTRTELAAMAITAFVAFGLRLPMLTAHELNCDEYYHTQFWGSSDDLERHGTNLTLWAGRFGGYYINYLFGSFVDSSASHAANGNLFAGFFLMMVFLILTGIFLARLWRFSDSLFAVTAITLFVNLHPFLQDMLFFRIGIATWFFLPAIVYVFLAVRKTFWSIFCCSLGFGLLLGDYQPCLNGAVTLCLMQIVIEGTRQLLQPKAPSLSRLWGRCGVTEKLAVAVFGVAWYAVLGPLTIMITGYKNHPYGRVASMEELPSVLQTMFGRYVQVFSLTKPLFETPFNFIPVLMSVFAGAGLLFLAVRTKGSNRLMMHKLFLAVFLVLLIFICSYMSTIGIMTPVVWNNNAPRVMFFISFFFAGMFGVAWLLTDRRPRIRRVLVGAVCFLFLAYAFFLSQLIYDMIRLSTFDRNLALRLVADLEKHPDFAKIRRVCILPLFVYPEYQKDIKGVKAEYFTSAYRWPHSKTHILNAVSGYEFQWAKYQEHIYTQRHPNLPVWPAPGSIVVDEDTAVIRLQ